MEIVQDAKVRTQQGSNFAVVHAGPFSQLDGNSFLMPALNRKVHGKLFVKDFLGSNSMQISMNKLPAGKGMPFHHHHKENEEAYVFVGGKGQMQVDGETFDVEEGSVVRIATAGSRCIRNNSDGDLLFLCIQAKEGSLTQDTFEDGVKTDDAVIWPD